MLREGRASQAEETARARQILVFWGGVEECTRAGEVRHLGERMEMTLMWRGGDREGPGLP